MMSQLTITINPYSGINDAAVNGLPLSPYSELSNYLQQPVLNWAEKLSGIAERQINDEYELMLVGEQFDVLFFGALLTGDGSLCKRYVGEGFSFSSLQKRFAAIGQLVQKYNCKVKLDDFKIAACSDCYRFDKLPLVKTVSTESAFLIITHNAASVNSAPANRLPRLIIVEGVSNVVQFRSDASYIWEVDRTRLDEVVGAIIDRFSKIPYIIAAAQELFSNNTLSDYDRQFLNLILSVEPLIDVDRIDRMAVGTTQKLSVKPIPAGAPLPEVRVVSSNPDVVGVDGLTLHAVAPGTTSIEVFKGSEFTPCYRQKVDVFQDKKAKRIILNRTEPNMGIGRTQKIDIEVLPVDAEDKDFIVWSSENPAVAEVDHSGIVTARSPGRTVVTASTSFVKESVIIDVLPNIQQMVASVQDITLNKGTSAPIAVSCVPMKCFDNSCNWQSNNSDVAYVETYMDGSSAIIAKDVGECILTCTANEGGCSVSCYVRVLDPVEEEKKQKKRVDLACIIGIPLAFLIFLIIMIVLFV